MRVVIIGAGYMGRTHADAYREIEGAELAGICDISAEAGDRFASAYGVKSYQSYDEVLEDSIDAVDICLPTSLHEEYIIKASEAGKSIFCEKPLTLTEDSLERIVSAVKKNGTYLQIGQVVRFWPEYEFAKSKADNGEYGDIMMATASRCSTHPTWSEWYRKPENSGGGLFDLHMHDVDFLVYLFGKVRSVYAIGRKNGLGAWNYVETSLVFANGAMATAEGIIDMPKSFPFSTQLKIAGTKGASISTMRAGANLENISSAVRDTFWYPDEGEPVCVDLELYDAYKKELEHFVAGKEDGKVDLESVCHSVRVILAAKQSLETGEVVEL